jgi:hypothetical protein
MTNIKSATAMTTPRNAAADWFQNAIADTPYTQNQISRISGMSESKLSLAINGLRHFKPREILVLADLLRIDPVIVLKKAAETYEWKQSP